MSERTIGELCEALVRLREEAEAGGGEKAVAKQHEKGKLTARERIDKLFDEGSFVELDTFVEHRCIHFGMGKKTYPGDGVVTGYGTVDGRLVYVYSQDFTVIGGSLGEMHARKICKVMDLAMQNGVPVLGLNDSGGARIQEAVDSLSGYGNIFYRNTVASGVVPQLSLILGPTAGGAVYSPALTDFIFMVDKIGILHITGPDVIKAVTGEDVTSEQIGGAMAHNQISGNAHFFATTEDECFAQVRKLLSYLPSNNMEEPPFYDSGDDPYRTDESLRDLVPTNPNKGYRVQDVLTRIADGGEFFEVQAMWAKNIVTGFMRVGGYVAGVIANQAAIMAGCLDIDASDKASRFIRYCDAFNIPIVTFVDVPGYLPGKNQELGGIIRHHADDAGRPGRREDALRLQRVHGAPHHGGPPQGLRWGLPGHVQQGPRSRRGPRVAPGRDSRHGRRGRRQHNLQEGDRRFTRSPGPQGAEDRGVPGGLRHALPGRQEGLRGQGDPP